MLKAPLMCPPISHSKNKKCKQMSTLVCFQVAVRWLSLDGGEQCDQSGLAVPHPAGVSAGSHHRSAEDGEHPLPSGPQVGAQTIQISAVCAQPVLRIAAEHLQACGQTGDFVRSR